MKNVKLQILPQNLISFENILYSPKESREFTFLPNDKRIPLMN